MMTSNAGAALTIESPLTIHANIGHEARPTASGGVHQHLHPHSQQVQNRVPLSGPEEVELAVERALAAKESWRRTPGEERRQLLLRLADLIEGHRAELVRFSKLDNGLSDTAGNLAVDIAAEFARYYAGWCDKIDGKLLSTMDVFGDLAYTVPEPIGVVGIIITWNGPLISLAMKVVPALAAGNCVICKPAELNAHVPEMFARLLKLAGFPDGVYSGLHGGPEAGEAIIRHKKIRKISFTGGPITARKILAACAEEIKPTVMELGGKSANLVFPDCDLDYAVQVSMLGVFFYGTGQGCALPTRTLVHADIYDEFLAKAKALVETLKVGDPEDPEVLIGPVMTAASADRIEGMFERARRDGAAKFLIGGGRCKGDLEGLNYIEPTIIVEPDLNHEISQVEIFGPALTIIKFHTEDEAVKIANSTEYGLSSYIQSNDLELVHRLAERLESGGVHVNGAPPVRAGTPFGGIGISGFGKEGGREGIDEFLHYKTVSIKAKRQM